MTKAEREHLIEEKNRVVGRQKESQAKIISDKRKIFFELNTKFGETDAMDFDTKNSQLTEDDRALLKVFFIYILIRFFNN